MAALRCLSGVFEHCALGDSRPPMEAVVSPSFRLAKVSHGGGDPTERYRKLEVRAGGTVRVD